ncbi:MAG: class I SAM-dependent methyltransferase [Planctomycetes bacterium]|nr:class I SAM-dependent methyltransferase [Planctomycetota bacterium]
MAVGYADFFKDIRYVGVDIAPQLIDWCKSHRKNPRHDYWADDFIVKPPREKFDLVFSQGTIDNTHDMDALLRAAVAASNRWVYVTAYRGFFPELREHRITWCEEQGVFYNDLSPLQAQQTLEQCGCQNVTIFPSFTGRDNVAHETVIIGSLPHEAPLVHDR